MRKQVRITLAVLLIGVAWVIAWQLLRDREPEPVYQGKGLRVWLREYEVNRFTEDQKELKVQNTAAGAIRKIGTNSIPTLLKMLAKKDSFIVSKFVDLWTAHICRIGYLPAWVRDPGWYQNRAAHHLDAALMGFEILGPVAQQAAPVLIKLYEQNISPQSQYATSHALIAIGPAAQTIAVPPFLRAAASSNGTVRRVAVLALSDVRAEPQLVVPVLVKALSDTNYFTRCAAANGLGEFGINAQQAVPSLVTLLRDPNPNVRRIAVYALKKIDPEAAAKAGVK